MPPRFLDVDGNPIGGDALGEEAELQEVIRNSNFTLLCEVNANPPPQITWFKDEQVRARGVLDDCCIFACVLYTYRCLLTRYRCARVPTFLLHPHVTSRVLCCVRQRVYRSYATTNWSVGSALVRAACQ